MRFTPGNLIDGRKVVSIAGTRERLSTDTTEITEVTISAEDDNSGKVVVGTTTVIGTHDTRRGIDLGPDDTITVPINQLHYIWLDAVSSGDGVTFLASAI